MEETAVSTGVEALGRVLVPGLRLLLDVPTHQGKGSCVCGASIEACEDSRIQARLAAPVRFWPNQHLCVRVLAHDGLYTFETRVAPDWAETEGAPLPLLWPDDLVQMQRRRDSRLRLDAEAWIRRGGPPPRSFPARILNISSQGVYLATGRVFRPREGVEVVLLLPHADSGKESWRAYAEVRHSEACYEANSDGLFRVGLRFIRMDSGERLERCLKEISRTAITTH